MSVKKVVWVTSFPKSGNTWVHSILRAAGRDFGFPQVDLDVYRLISAKETPQACNLVKGGGGEATVLKTHAIYSEMLHPELALKTAGFCHVIRNPLDVLLSYINFSRIQYGGRKDDKQYQQKLFIDLLGLEQIMSFDDWKQTTLDDLPRSVLDSALSYFTENAGEIPTFRESFTGTWFDHANTWFNAREHFPSLALRYEDLLVEEAGFLKLTELFEITEEAIFAAIEEISLLNQKKSKNLTQPEDNIFFNKMSSYYYLDYFSKSKIRDFLLKYELQLKLLGYSGLPY